MAQYDEFGGGGFSQDAYENIPDRVRNMLHDFRMALYSGESKEAKGRVAYIYERQWPEISEQMYKDSLWPSAEAVRLEWDVQDGDIALILYKELYYRHIFYTRPNPALDQRAESFENFCDLFNMIVHSADDPTQVDELAGVELPPKWLWDIIDEFIYQFESFSQYRARLKKDDPELAIVKENPRLWNVHIVLNVLHSLIDKSNINQQLEAFKNGENPNEVAGEFGTRQLYKFLGYFSLVGLLRLHCLLGDYHQALRVMEHIELDKKGLYSRVPACQVSVFYYVSFSYMMMGRYKDAVRVMSNILFYIYRAQLHQQRALGGFNVITKKRDQLYLLLAIVMTLCPQRIEDYVQRQLLDRCGEDMQKMEKGDEASIATFDDLFSKGCPRFISPTPVVAKHDDADAVNEPLMHQKRVFLADIRRSLSIPNIRSYLKLYSTMQLDKLASFFHVDTATLRTSLHQYKHKTNQLAWISGTPLEGEQIPSADVDFYIDGDMLHIADVKVERSFGEYFCYLIGKNLPIGL
mmetsp:Transcript_32903/g.86125  ORF Transcript_32903/g.86125 Transcript_32903/m.86125 type:complete len:521 (+) Transcript_32903:167-1729(+)|eukprot:CAMPEP_0182924938 /NCGR_PEP_ID=MMETSP0105_2-20130417/8039_1 /TAXON_ID=81532 ORGANISM="Acanthoeca-like sp., Strain 10tr" /NCGR_SAMPLE_ID=MMETSP0105_2 /ASSEMBLY_ACC=CAM_ASM_000205 /LENGTH=520 /DNA_ID=CAMNT_0025062761 /DNA_START=167 /DNA_END=1729 /DNA_ORIENTATION=+